MKRKSVRNPPGLIWGCVFFAWACGNSKTEDPPKTAPVSTENSAPAAHEAKATADNVPPAQADGRPQKTLIAAASLAPQVEGFPSDFEITIDVFENGKTTGKATIGDTVLHLDGDLTEGNLRLWAQADDKSALRSGFFIGASEGQTASGSFALSGNGGNPSLQGTWKSL